MRQYHEERDGKNIKVTEYFLGHYNKETHDVRLKEEIEHEKSGRKPLRKKIESINMPFYELTMKGIKLHESITSGVIHSGVQGVRTPPKFQRLTSNTYMQ